MKDEIKIKTREVPKIEYYLYCPICKDEIKGTSAGQVEWNIKKHLEKHSKEELKKEDLKNEKSN